LREEAFFSSLIIHINFRAVVAAEIRRSFSFIFLGTELKEGGGNTIAQLLPNNIAGTKHLPKQKDQIYKDSEELTSLYFQTH
jgi:hypothetical protein